MGGIGGRGMARVGKAIPPRAQRALDVYDLRTVGSWQDRQDARDRLQGLLTRMTNKELVAYYAELVRRRMEEKDGGAV